MITLETTALEPSSIFLDRSALMAFMKKDHPFHQRATSFFYELDDLDRPLVTLNLTIYQLHEKIQEETGSEDAGFFLQVIQKAEQSGLLTVIPVDESIEKAALQLMEDNPNQGLTFFEACNLSVVEYFGIGKIFSFDPHLESICRGCPHIKLVPSFL